LNRSKGGIWCVADLALFFIQYLIAMLPCHFHLSTWFDMIDHYHAIHRFNIGQQKRALLYRRSRLQWVVDENDLFHWVGMALFDSGIASFAVL
jgi:hypothetical protein